MASKRAGAAALVLSSLLPVLDLIYPRALCAQTVQIAPDRTSLQLSYTKTLNSIVTVEKSGDLVSWIPITASNEIIAQNQLTETISSTIPLGGSPRLFFRLRVENAWKVSLAWMPSLEPVAGYYLHYGTSHGNYTQHLDVGKATAVSVPLPLTASKWYFVVSAYNSIGLESLPSKELKVRYRTKGSNKR